MSSSCCFLVQHQKDRIHYPHTKAHGCDEDCALQSWVLWNFRTAWIQRYEVAVKIAGLREPRETVPRSGPGIQPSSCPWHCICGWREVVNCKPKGPELDSAKGYVTVSYSTAQLVYISVTDYRFLTPTRSHTKTHRHTGSQSHTVTHSHTQSHTDTHSHTQSHTVTHSYTQSHTVTHSHTQSYTVTHSHTQSHTQSHTVTHRHTDTQTHINTQVKQPINLPPSTTVLRGDTN